MDFRLERALRQKPDEEIEYKELYSRALTEINDRGAQVGGNMIPWGWTTNFVATEFTVSESLRIETADPRGGPHVEQQTTHRNLIQARLKPGRLNRIEDIGHREPTYRFFGTDRAIEEFRLDILPVSEPSEEGCSAFGSVSYDFEVDFRTETTTDTLQFYLMVSQNLFDRYLWNIGQGLTNQLALAIGFVDGFYAEWSPGITAQVIKVLAGPEHKIQEGDGTEWPRLGKVGNCEFFMNGHFALKAVGQSAFESDEERRGIRAR